MPLHPFTHEAHEGGGYTSLPKLAEGFKCDRNVQDAFTVGPVRRTDCDAVRLHCVVTQRSVVGQSLGGCCSEHQRRS